MAVYRTRGTIYGGHLVTINTEEENNWIVNQFGSTIYWIGLYQPTSGPEPDGGWEWVSGEPVSYTIWLIEYPSNHMQPDDNEGVEDWVTINFWDTGHWNDEPLTGFNSSHKGIIELNQAP